MARPSLTAVLTATPQHDGTYAARQWKQGALAAQRFRTSADARVEGPDQTTDQKVRGSNPFGRTTLTSGYTRSGTLCKPRESRLGAKLGAKAFHHGTSSRCGEPQSTADIATAAARLSPSIRCP